MGYLFAALLGFNPMGTLLGPQVLNSLPAATAEQLTSRSYFPQLISAPFHHGLTMVLIFSLIVCLIAAAASWVRGGKYIYEQEVKEKALVSLPVKLPDKNITEREEKRRPNV